MLKALLRGISSGRVAEVDEEKAVRVCSYAPDLPPLNTPSRYRYYQGLLGSTGIDSGTTDQSVNGSVTAQEFYVQAEDVPDIYIMGVGIIIADANVAHNQFGGVAALSTGWDLKIEDETGTTFLIEKASTGGRVLARTGFARPYGNGATSNELTAWNTNEDATTVWFPVGEYTPGGLRLGRGTNDRLVSVVNDDLTGLTEFEVRVFGYRHYPRGK